MWNKWSLRRRIALSYILLAITLGTFFCATAYFSVEVAEQYLVEKRLQSFTAQLIAEYRKGESMEIPQGIQVYMDDEAPPHLQQLKAGFHDYFFEGKEQYAVILSEDKHRWVVVDTENDYSDLEGLIHIGLGGGFVGSLALAIFLGFAIAKRVITPVTQLAQAIDRKLPANKLPSLESEDEIGILARSFAAYSNELQRFLNREKVFTGDVSHELRTPLMIILGAAEVLEAQLVGHPQSLAVAERIRRTAQDTAERVSALLLLSRAPENIDAPRIEMKSLVERELARCEPLLIRKSLKCRIDAPYDVWVYAHPELVGIAVGNLLRNACQYTHAGVIDLYLTDHHLIVEDSGPGIPDSVRSQLFERFVRGDSGHQSGTGLGLAIVKRVVDHLTWEIHFDTSVNGGTRVTLFFPKT